MSIFCTGFLTAGAWAKARGAVSAAAAVAARPPARKLRRGMQHEHEEKRAIIFLPTSHSGSRASGYPESITTGHANFCAVSGYGFRVRGLTPAPRKDVRQL